MVMCNRLLSRTLRGKVRLFVVIFGAAVWMSVPAWGQEATQRHRSTGSAPVAPNFALKTIDGDVFRLREHRGDVVVLNFWATWCAPCRREIPGFVELQREYSDRGLQFVGVAVRDVGVEAVRQFARAMDINYPVGLDDGTIAEKYGGVWRLPTTYVIGPEGKVRGHIPGLVPPSRLRSVLEKLLEETL